MTCIAWDGKTLAADRLAVNGSLKGTITKIAKTECGNFLYGYSANADIAAELIEWWLGGADPKEFPPLQRNKDDWSGLLIICRDGAILKFERTPIPITFPPQQMAIGCGRDFAMAAMYLGKNAKEAVEVACALDAFCGNGIDVLTFE